MIVDPLSPKAKGIDLRITNQPDTEIPGNQSPSILYMALAALAATHTVEEMQRRNL